MGRFTDVTAGSGLEHKTGWGQACCVGDYNERRQAMMICLSPTMDRMRCIATMATGRLNDVTQQAGTDSTGAEDSLEYGLHRFVDYDRDGNLDLFVANYVDFDLKTAPKPEDGPCTYKGILWPAGLLDCPEEETFFITTKAMERSAM